MWTTLPWSEGLVSEVVLLCGSPLSRCWRWLLAPYLTAMWTAPPWSVEPLRTRCGGHHIIDDVGLFRSLISSLMWPQASALPILNMYLFIYLSVIPLSFALRFFLITFVLRKTTSFEITYYGNTLWVDWALLNNVLWCYEMLTAPFYRIPSLCKFLISNRDQLYHK